MNRSRKKKKVRRAKRATSPAKPLLSLAMMVKNEEAFLEDALRSAHRFCDELVVVDTGSTDRTVEIARDMGAKVSFFEWCDSFSKARNETLRQATGQWVAILDADERFVGQNPERIREHLIPAAQYPYQALMLNVVNTRLDGTPISSFFSVRLFPNDPRLGYSGRVHNRFGAMSPDAPKVAATRYTGLEIIHLGYDPELYKARQKAARSLPLIEATVREEPDNHQQRFYLGREYLLLGRLEDAQSALSLAFEGTLRSGNGPLVDIATHLMQAMLSGGIPAQEVLKVGRTALSHAPHHPDLWMELGRVLISVNVLQEGVDALERALLCLEQQVTDGSQVRLAHRRWEVHEFLGRGYWGLGRYQASYRHYLSALPNKPAESAGWPVMLNSLCALAIELGDNDRLPGLLDRLFLQPDAPLGMFFFELDRVTKNSGVDAARALLLESRAKCARLENDPDYAQRARHLGIL